MPAVIIEGAYISNPGDLNYMKTDDFREKYAMSAAKCIIEALNNGVENKEDNPSQGEPFF
jgi:N-acetylmuramoyl-L-alanine amidase